MQACRLNWWRLTSKFYNMNNSIKVKKSIKAAKKAFKKGFDLWYYTGDYNEKNERLMSCISEQQERFNEEFINDKQYYIF